MTGSGQKSDWPGWKKLDYCFNDCPCCEAAPECKDAMVDCALNWKTSDGCMDPDSIYQMWEEAASEDVEQVEGTVEMNSTEEIRMEHYRGCTLYHRERKRMKQLIHMINNM